MRSRCAATSATSSQSSSSVSSTSLTIAGTPRPRNTHSTTTSCRLSSAIMSATPNAYWRTCSMRRNHTADQVGHHAPRLVVLLLGANPHILSIHVLLLQEAAEWCHLWKKQMCGNNGHAHSLTHLHSVRFPTHKGGVMWKRCPPHSAYTRAHAIATPYISHRKIEPCANTRPQRKECIQLHTAQPFTSLRTASGVPHSQ
ncbi:hypothetical protein TcCL_NonESM11014 [Trypanosoma cruzi]|nr:hypothetical protein TcCL_NonESM11014 [Trypanosoma cruzi]